MYVGMQLDEVFLVALVNVLRIAFSSG
jgi:hypothetical protein